MIHTFPIEFLRQALEQHLLKKHIENPNYFGGSNQIQLFSFYEQLKGQDEVDRFVERYRDLTEQQNRANLIGNGILLSPENPTITNLYSSLIIPMTWTCSIRTMLQNRDQMIETLFELIDELKGRKVDIAELKCTDENGKVYYQPFCVGTVGHNDGGFLQIKNGDYIGVVGTNPTSEQIKAKITAIDTLIGDETALTTGRWFYLSVGGVLSVARYTATTLTTGYFSIVEDDGSYTDIIFPPEHTSFTKYKMSLSFDSLRCDTPKTLNGNEYCEISFGGSATLVSDGVKLGNDMVKVSFEKSKIAAETDITWENADVYFLEPLEMPSGNGAGVQSNLLTSNFFKANSHTDSNTITLQYTFIADDTQDILKQWFDYGRYGIMGTSQNQISPNMIYEVVEYWSSWAVITPKTYLGKLIESVDIENTESDSLTISITIQVQGENQ